MADDRKAVLNRWHCRSAFHGDLKMLTMRLRASAVVSTSRTSATRKKFSPGLDPSAWLIEVLSHQGVRIVSRHTGLYGRREVLLSVSLQDGEPFPFGRFLPREEFVIGLQSRFLQQGDVLEVLRLASGLEMSAVMVAEDDGISQRTTTRQGIALKETVTVKGRVKLRPYRTFREVEQPVSEFVFRLRSKEGMVPECALFEADGGTWKLDAVLTIKAWLEAKNLNIPVIA